jgi:hypothetical protein
MEKNIEAVGHAVVVETVRETRKHLGGVTHIL